MYLKMMIVLVLTIGFSGFNALQAENVQTKGVKPGVWTMDLDAAKKLAKEKKWPRLFRKVNCREIVPNSWGNLDTGKEICRQVRESGQMRYSAYSALNLKNMNRG